MAGTVRANGQSPWRAVIDLSAMAAALVVARDEVGLARADRPWVAPATFGVLGLVALCGPTRHRLMPQPGAASASLLMVWVAVYACVPETSDQMFHVAALLVVMGATELVTRSLLPWWAHTCATAVTVWAGLYGSTGRPSAVVGALFALWPLVLPNVVAMVVPAFERASARWRWVVLLVAGTASVAVARLGALGATLAPAARDAALAAGISAVAAFAVAVTVTRRAGRASGTTGSITS